MNHTNFFKGMHDELESNPQINLTKWEIKSRSQTVILEEAKARGVPEKILALYEIMNGFAFNWTNKTYKDNKAKGCAEIITLEGVIQDWQGVIYFDNTDKDDPIRNFHPLDFFINEACVGIYLAKKRDPSLYLYFFEDQPYGLDIDIEGYLELLRESRGFFCWQNVLRGIRTGRENVEQREFKEFMPQVFPDFSYEEFANKYESLRLSKA